MSTRISSLSIRTTLPSTTSPCLKLLMSASCSASSSAIVVGSGRVAPGGRGGSSSSGSLVGRRRIGGVVRVGVAGLARLRRTRSRRRASAAAIGCRRPAASVASASAVDRRPRRRIAGRRPRRRVGPRSPSRRSRPRRARPSAAAASPLRLPRRLRSALGLALGRGRRARQRLRWRDGLLGAGSSAEAFASGSGAVPPSCSSVKGSSSPVDRFRPSRITNGLSRAQAVSSDAEWCVGDWPRPFLRGRYAESVSSLSCREGRESLALGVCVATISAPCPSFPT